MTGADWLARLPMIGNLPPEVAVAKLRELGEDDLADAVAGAPQQAPQTYGLLSALGIGTDRAWLHTGHAVGHVRPAGPGAGPLPVSPAAAIAADQTLAGARVKVTLDGLRVAGYPGRGVHNVLFDFAARNQADTGPELLHFNAAYRAREGEHAPVSGRPVFTGLRVGGEGLFLQFATVNVSNEDDEALLAFLDGDAFQAGLQLLTIAQPVLAPFTALAVGLTEAIAKRTRNVPVQAVDLGLDFSQIATRAKLAEGSYIAVQVPAGRPWRWQDWAYDPGSGQLASTRQPGLQCPCNYVIVSVSRHAGP